jgi:TfoX/Sxy family transcriptional regulator of competence genes
VGGEWRKSPRKLVEAFDRAIARFPKAERRSMFGCACVFVNGNMAGGLHEERWIIRLQPAERAELLASGGNEFAPMGRVMKEYVTLPRGIVEDPAQLHQWLARSFAYVQALPAKLRKGRAIKSKRGSQTST